MIEVEDRKIVSKCLAGDGKAFELIIEKYQKTLFNLAYRMVKNSDDAEDITQSAFIKAYENLKRYNFKYKFFSWLYRIAINESLNFINKKNKKDDLPDEIVEQSDQSDKEIIKNEIANQIQKSLMQIDPKYRVLVVMYHFQNKSYAEMSEILHLPEKTVKSRLFTARQLLKDIFTKYGIVSYES